MGDALDLASRLHADLGVADVVGEPTVRVPSVVADSVLDLDDEPVGHLEEVTRARSSSSRRI
jgi:hypothetical protein